MPGCAYLTAHPPTSGTCKTPTTFNGSVTLTAGRYCNQVLFDSSSKVVFSAGVYDFEYGLTFNGTPNEIDGTGVTFYINNGAWIINGSPIVKLSAPTTGNTAGILIFQPTTNTNDFHLNSGGSSGTGVYDGALYLPAAKMLIDGKYVSWAQAIAKDIVFNAGGGVASLTSSAAITHAVLAE